MDIISILPLCYINLSFFVASMKFKLCSYIKYTTEQFYFTLMPLVLFIDQTKISAAMILL